VENTKVKGDFRFRYQYQDTDESGVKSRDRWRIRWRFGLETQVNENWKTGFRLSSGSGDPRSRNLTLEDTFDTTERVAASSTHLWLHQGIYFKGGEKTDG